MGLQVESMHSIEVRYPKLYLLSKKLLLNIIVDMYIVRHMPTDELCNLVKFASNSDELTSRVPKTTHVHHARASETHSSELISAIENTRYSGTTQSIQNKSERKTKLHTVNFTRFSVSKTQNNGAINQCISDIE